LKFHKDKVIQWKKKLPPIMNESDDETEEGVKRKELMQYRVPQHARKQARGRGGKDGFNLLQSLEDQMLKPYQIQQQVFRDRTDRMKFFEYCRSYNNECATDKEEECFLEALKEFEKQRTMPTGVLTKIRDNHLILDGEHLTSAEASVLSNFIYATRDEDENNVLHFHVKNCGL